MEKTDQKIVIYWSWKKTISLIAAILLIPAILIWIFAFVLKTTTINPGYYKSVLMKANTYDRLIKDGIPSLIVGSTVSQDAATDILSKELIVFVIQKSVDPIWVQNLTEKVIDQIVVFLGSDNTTGKKIEVNLADAETFLDKTNDGLILLNQMIPSCNENDTGSNLLSAMATGTVNCKDMNVNPDEVKKDIVVTQEKISDFKLGMVNLEKDVTQVNDVIVFIQKFVKNVNSYFWWSMTISLALILLIIILNLTDWLAASKFISVPLLLASVFSFGIILVLNPIASVDYTNLALNLPYEMNAIVADVLKYQTLGIFHRLEITTGIILAVALIIYFIMPLLISKKKV